MTGDSHTLIEAAGEYLAAGLVLLAVSGKLPNGKFHRHWKEDAIFGVPESAEDVELLARIFGDESTTGIAVVLPANLLVVDIDGEDGAQAWNRLAERHGFDLVPDTPITRTGKGLHLWFLDGRERRNGDAVLSQPGGRGDQIGCGARRPGHSIPLPFQIWLRSGRDGREERQRRA